MALFLVEVIINNCLLLCFGITGKIGQVGGDFNLWLNEIDLVVLGRLRGRWHGDHGEQALVLGGYGS